jgi:hypothetical protein
MKLVQLTAADVEKFQASMPKEKAATPDFHHEELEVDALSIGLVRPSASEDPRTNTYSIGFRCGDSEYVIVVRPTIHQVPSVTLDIITKGEFASYTVLRDTVTTLKGQVADLSARFGHLRGST